MINLISFILYHIVVVLIIIHIVMDNRQPAKTVAWALVIWFVPVVGMVLYFFFGTNTRKERMASQRSMDELTKRSMLQFVEQHNLHLPQQHRKLIDLFINESTALPFRDGTAEVYTDGYQFFPALMAAMAAAKSHIHIDIYIFEDDALGRMLRDLLIDKARQGVEVRLIYDDVGCFKVGNQFFERMREEGIEALPFLPVRFPKLTSRVNYRNHRKIVVVDGEVGFIGGMNFAIRYVKSKGWRDTMVRLTGGAVYSLQRAFLIDWYFVDRTLLSDRKYYPDRKALPTPMPAPRVGEAPSTDVIQLVTSGPVAPYAEIMQGYVHVILAARRYVYMETPYFLPTEPVLFAMKTAASAGVDVRLLVPLDVDAWVADWAGRSYLREVQAAGIQVRFYTPGFLHSKLMVSDDGVCTCGSTNIDFRSFENNFEANIFVYGEETAMRFRDIYLADEQHSLPLTEVPSRYRPHFFARLVESLFRLFSPLM